MNQAGLFGIKYSNRDFTSKDSWGKNQFNSAFPVALCAYMSHLGLENIYLTLDENLKIAHKTISTEAFLEINPLSDNLFYAFESVYSPFQQFVIGSLPRVDLVTQRRDDKTCLNGIEIKLTALPDNTTCELSEAQYGCEIVVRPDTIVYLACSLAANFEKTSEILRGYFDKNFDNLKDWTEPNLIRPLLPQMISVLNHLSKSLIEHQKPFLMQPIWKTEGKSPRLAENCLDVFVWSDLAFIRLFLETAHTEGANISRQSRTVVWFFKMLYDFAKNGHFNPQKIIDSISLNTKNDKAFAISGRVTHSFMTCPELTEPRIQRQQIREIILGGGQNLLSPERRFDAIIFNSPNLFV